MKTALLVVLLVAGCAGVPPVSPVKPDSSATAIPHLPAPGAAAERRLPIERWWTVFGDAQLERLMDEALARNEDLEAAVARVREAQAHLDAARGAQAPAVELQAGSARSQVSEVGATPIAPGMARRASSHRLALEATYDVDLWGRLSSATEAARAQLLATQWARSALEWALTARLAESYFGLAAVERQLEISEAVRRLRQASAGLRSREYDAGAGNEFELRRAQAELADVEASLAALRRQRLSLQRALIALLGRTPQEAAEWRVGVAALDEEQGFTVVLPQGAASELLVRRPDVRQAEAELAAANYSIEAARAAALPAVRLTGSVGSDARSIGELFSGPAAVWSLGASLAQALVDGGRAEARWREERARAEQALAGYRKTVTGAVLDVRESYAALELAEQAVTAAHLRVAALARSYELAQRGFAAGALARLDLLDAERNWYQAQLDRVGALRDQRVGQVSAFKALGGGHL